MSKLYEEAVKLLRTDLQELFKLLERHDKMNYQLSRFKKMYQQNKMGVDYEGQLESTLSDILNSREAYQEKSFNVPTLKNPLKLSLAVSALRINPDRLKEWLKDIQLDETDQYAMEAVEQKLKGTDKELAESLDKLFSSIFPEVNQSYEEDKDRTWYYLDRKNLRNDFLQLIITCSKASSAPVLLFPKDDSALTNSLPDMFIKWWQDLDTSTNLHPDPVQLEGISSSEDELEINWLIALFKNLSDRFSLSDGQSDLLMDTSDKFIDRLNTVIAEEESALGSTNLIFVQPVNGQNNINVLLGIWEKIKWKRSSLFLIIASNSDDSISENSKVSLYGDEKRHYELIDSEKLEDFCRRHKTYELSRELKSNSRLSLQQSLKLLRWTG